MDNTIFKQQIAEDINLLKENIAWNDNINKDEYAFNYWILSNIYNLDEEGCSTNITEYNDKAIDCFVHFEEDKELYIIQNKYYDDNTRLSPKEISDFLTRPLSILKEGKYTRSIELQKIYNNIKNDDSYKIFLHFYITNNNKSDDIERIIKNNKPPNIIFKIFYLDDLKNKYYGKSFKEKQKLTVKFETGRKAAILAIRPKDYNLPNMSEAYYAMVKIRDIYKLWVEAEKKQYSLFEENIREYLGGSSGINKGIIDTLRNEEQRGNFFYYNNGITIICDSAKASSKDIIIENPQIVNGCQTVNSISEVLNLESDMDIEKNFGGVYVMAKILVLEKNNSVFYRDIVKYTNSQNSINDNVFGATLQPFFTIQDILKNYGILLNVKQSDKYKFKENYRDKKKFVNILQTANKFSQKDFFEFKSINDILINLETLIQIIGSFIKDAHFAYTKKSVLLKPLNKEIYQNFSSKIGDLFTTESFVKLILLYKKSELDKKNSDDKKSPSPYYLLNFIGYYLKEQKIDHQFFLKHIQKDDLFFIYEKFKNLTTKYYKLYKEKNNLEYNQMIKKEIDINIMNLVLNEHLEGLKEHNKQEYYKLLDIFENIKNKQ